MSNVAVRQEDLDGYAAYAAKYNEVQKPTFKKLQLLNKEGRDGFGKWFVGRKYEGREVVEVGEEVAAIVVIDHYGQYSLYDKDQNKNLCRCDLYHGAFPPNGTRGSKFGNECGPKCPYRQGTKKACKVQRVVFCVAITKDGNKIPCIYYAKGSGFMPFVEFMNKSASQIINGKLINLPAFAYTINLASREDVNGDTIFNVPIFKFGQLVPVEKLEEFALLAEQVQNYVKTSVVESDDSEDGETCQPPVNVQAPAQVTPIRQDMDTMDDAPWGGDTVQPTVVASEDSGDTDDLAASISKALGL